MELTIPKASDKIGPGLYRIDADAYHADPALTPSLSSSIAHLIVNVTPLEARAKHPRLNGKGYVRELASNRMNIGAVAHHMLLGHGDELAILDFPDFRTNAAKAARDEAVENGLTPLLKKDASRAENIAEKLSARLRAIVPGVLVDGAPEVTMIWRDEHGCLCRSRVDWWGPTENEIIDIKTTTGGLDDRSLSFLIKDGLDVRAGHYIRGLRALHPGMRGPVRYRFAFIQQDEPYDLRVVELDSTGYEIGQRKAAYAAAIFAHCVEARDWPGYPPKVTSIEYPKYAETDWLARETYDLMLTHLGVRPRFQSPFAPLPAIPREGALEDMADDV